MNNRVVIVSAFRTGIGSFSGALAGVSAHKLGSHLIKKTIESLADKVMPNEISEVIIGQGLSQGCKQNPARQAAIEGGLPYETPAWLVNQVCGSSLRAVISAYSNIRCGLSKIVIAGGQENMSQVPHAIALRKEKTKLGDAKLSDLLLTDGLLDAFSNQHMAMTAEGLADRYSITRAEQDDFAAESHYKAVRAHEQKLFESEIVGIQLEKMFTIDESVRSNTDFQILSKLKPAFKTDGTVTAGNASPINDGAAVLTLMSESEAIARGITPLAAIVSLGMSGVDPELMGIAPVKACHNALETAGWSINDLDLIESNEAFAVQAICVNREMNWDTEKVNINGGSIALGHPIGASGARILVTLIHALRNRGGGKGLATLCIGGGMGLAICVQSIEERKC